MNPTHTKGKSSKSRFIARFPGFIKLADEPITLNSFNALTMLLETMGWFKTTVNERTIGLHFGNIMLMFTKVEDDIKFSIYFKVVKGVSTNVATFKLCGLPHWLFLEIICRYMLTAIKLGSVEILSKKQRKKILAILSN